MSQRPSSDRYLQLTVLLNSAGGNFNKINERSTTLAVAKAPSGASIRDIVDRIYSSNIQVTPGFLVTARRYTTRVIDPMRITDIPLYAADRLSEINDAQLTQYVNNPGLRNLMTQISSKNVDPATVQRTLQNVKESGIAPLDPTLATTELLNKPVEGESVESAEDIQAFENKFSPIERSSELATHSINRGLTVSPIAATAGGASPSAGEATSGVSGTISEVITPKERTRRGAMGPVEMAEAGIGGESSTHPTAEEIAALGGSISGEAHLERETRRVTSEGIEYTEANSETSSEHDGSFPPGYELPTDPGQSGQLSTGSGQVFVNANQDQLFTPTVYHRAAITTFFNDADRPKWDPQLSILADKAYKEVSQEERAELIKTLIFTKGQNFLVIRPKSDPPGALQELVEVIQLLFSSKRSMSRGPRITMAGVSLGSLLSGQSMGQQSATSEAGGHHLTHDREPRSAGDSYTEASSYHGRDNPLVVNQSVYDPVDLPVKGQNASQSPGTPQSTFEHGQVVTPNELPNVPTSKPTQVNKLVPVDSPDRIKDLSDAYKQSSNFHGFGSTGPRIAYPILTGTDTRSKEVGPGLTWLPQFPPKTTFKVELKKNRC